jgi:hypothetical protein
MSASPDRRPVRWHWSRVLLVVPFVATMWVPSYNTVDPAIWGIPFFYWYQLAWIIISGALIGAVYFIEHRG